MTSRRKIRSAQRTRLTSACFLAPSAVGVLVFFVIPFGVIVYYSLVDNPIQQSFVGLDNYISLLQNTAFRLAARNSLLFPAWQCRWQSFCPWALRYCWRRKSR